MKKLYNFGARSQHSTKCILCVCASSDISGKNWWLSRLVLACTGHLYEQYQIPECRQILVFTTLFSLGSIFISE